MVAAKAVNVKPGEEVSAQQQAADDELLAEAVIMALVGVRPPLLLDPPPCAPSIISLRAVWTVYD